MGPDKIIWKQSECNSSKMQETYLPLESLVVAFAAKGNIRSLMEIHPSVLSLNASTGSFYHYSLTKLMVSHDLLCSTVTNQIAFDQRDSKSISKSERPMDRCCQALLSCFFFWLLNWKPWIPSVLTDWHNTFVDETQHYTKLVLHCKFSDHLSFKIRSNQANLNDWSVLHTTWCWTCHIFFCDQLNYLLGRLSLE